MEENKAPPLLELLFREEASAAMEGADERSWSGGTRDGIWAGAFEEWIAERGKIYKPSTTKQTILAFRRLLRHQRKMLPGLHRDRLWELKQEDIEQHRDWMAAEGYAASTIYNDLGTIANFYRWCDKRRIDPECETGPGTSSGTSFNPAAGVKRPRVKRYDGVQLLSKGEVEALLGITQQDESALGKRDYAFILARLRMGVPLKVLQEMSRSSHCGINRDKFGTSWGKMPREVHEAIVDYLEVSGRLAGMKEGEYIFAPLAQPGSGRENDQAEDWVGERPLSQSAILASLKLYGGLVGIPEEKLTMQTLRRTATRLRLDEGDSIDDMRVFLDSEEETRLVKYRLGKLPKMPEEGEKVMEDDRREVPDRKGKPFKPGEGMIHGYYANTQPPEEVLAVMAEDIQGIDEEIRGLRRLARGLVVWQRTAKSSKEAVQAADVHSRAAARLSEMVEAEKLLEGSREEDDWVEQNLMMLDKMAMKYGEEAVSEGVWADARVNDPEQGISGRCLVEEIATARYMLRNVLAAARKTEVLADYMRMVEIYGGGCVRLVRMLKREKGDRGRLRRYLEEAIDQAIREVVKEWGR